MKDNQNLIQKHMGTGDEDECSVNNTTYAKSKTLPEQLTSKSTTNAAAIFLAQKNKNTHMNTSTSPRADSAQHAADTTQSVDEEFAGTSSAKPKDSHEHHRRVMPRLDLDDSIAAAREAIKQAKKDMMEARRVNKNEKRKKKETVAEVSPIELRGLGAHCSFETIWLGNRGCTQCQEGTTDWIAGVEQR